MQINEAKVSDGWLCLRTNEAAGFVYRFKPGDYEITKAKKKRSLDANAYYHVLITRLSKAVGATVNELHNTMLRRYGQPEIIGGKMVYLTVPDTEEAEKKALEASEYHIKPTSQVRIGKDGISYRTYSLLRGSHTYSVDEMNALLEGLKSECTALGIETMTPDDIRRFGIE